MNIDHAETQAYGITQQSTEFVKKHLRDTGPIGRIECFLAGNTHLEQGEEQWVAFVDENSNRIIVSGFSWGYAGEGPHGLLRMAQELGFNLDIDNIAHRPQGTPWIIHKGVEVETKVAVEILGNKAWITSVTGRPADPPWWPEDRIQVWLDFEKPPQFALGCSLSFGVNLPVRSYTRDEFLAAVSREGEHRLKVELEGNRTKRALRESKEQKQKELDKIAGEIKALIGLD